MERKDVCDLASSIIGKRYDSQKARLLQVAPFCFSFFFFSLENASQRLAVRVVMFCLPKNIASDGDSVRIFLSSVLLFFFFLFLFRFNPTDGDSDTHLPDRGPGLRRAGASAQVLFFVFFCYFFPSKKNQRGLRRPGASAHVWGLGLRCRAQGLRFGISGAGF